MHMNRYTSLFSLNIIDISLLILNQTYTCIENIILQQKLLMININRTKVMISASLLVLMLKMQSEDHDINEKKKQSKKEQQDNAITRTTGGINYDT